MSKVILALEKYEKYLKQQVLLAQIFVKESVNPEYQAEQNKITADEQKLVSEALQEAIERDNPCVYTYIKTEFIEQYSTSCGKEISANYNDSAYCACCGRRVVYE